MHARLLGTGGLLMALVALFAVNILSGTALTSARLDLTENDIYTLSEGTRATLAQLDEPITLRFYLSRGLITQVPGISNYAARVRELLDEYRRTSGGKITMQVVDPEPFSEAEDRAVGYGLRGLPVNDGQDALYFGLVGTNSVDDEETIAFFSINREQFLEYDLTKLIHTLGNPQRKVVGLLTSLQMGGTQVQYAAPGTMTPPWVIVEQMRQLFDVRELDPDEPIPEDIDVLMLAHPQHFESTTLYAVDQYVMGNGRALVFVDPNSDSQPVTMLGGVADPDRRSDPGPLLSAWGIGLDLENIVGDLSLAPTVQMEKGGRMVTFNYPAWMNVQPELFNADDIVTGELGNVAFGSAGALSALDGATTEFTPLVTTSENAKRFPNSAVASLADPQDMLQDYQPEGERFTLVARVTGPAQSAFPDGPPPVEGMTLESSTHLAQSIGDINLIVVADTDLLHDRFWVQVQNMLGTRLLVPTAANGSLVVNALDNLTGSSDLISVRNRGSFLRPFELINELRREAELRFRENEYELSERLDATEERLVELEDRKQGDDAMILSEAQQDELSRFRDERLRIRKELRDVRRELRQDIDQLERSLKFANIGLMPLLIALTGLLAGLWRLNQRRRSQTQSAQAPTGSAQPRQGPPSPGRVRKASSST